MRTLRPLFVLAAMSSLFAVHLRADEGCVPTTKAPCVRAVAQPPPARVNRSGVRERRLLANAGLYGYFDRRGYPNGYFSGDIVHNWDQLDPVVGTTVEAEITLQLDKIRGLGVNTIDFELRTSDGSATLNFTPPDCNINPSLGLLFPQPTATELANLQKFFDLVQSKGMKVWLLLVNTHMEQRPPTNSQTWLAAILGAIGRHPALDLVFFDGAPYTQIGGQGTLVCGIPAEAPLWLGPGSIPATYVQWAIGFGLSQGIPASKLSTEAVVGSYVVESQTPSGATATDGHLWSPIKVEKGIFDALGIPAVQRTYGLSFYEHRKCNDAPTSPPCTDADPHTWADETLQFVTSVVEPGARIVVPEMGLNEPADASQWNTPHALESLVFLLNKYGIADASFWRWVNSDNREESDPTLALPVKLRGVAFNYTTVKNEVIDMAGLHLPVLPNTSFEGDAINGVPVDWTAAGDGTVSRYPLSTEPGQPDVPSRGIYSMRIVTGTGGNATVSATSAWVPASPGTTYTTTSNCRFSWANDPDPQGPAATRPQVFVSVLYFGQNGKPSAIRPSDTFSFFQENSTTGFATFPVVYTTPADTALVAIRFGASRNGLSAAITFDVDNVR